MSHPEEKSHDGFDIEDPFVGSPPLVVKQGSSLPDQPGSSLSGLLKSAFDGILHSSHTAASRLRVRSALNPMLWLCAITCPICFFAAYFFDDQLRTLLIVVGILPIIATVLGFAGFALFNSAKLQSEDFQIRQQLLQLVQQRGGQLTINPISPDAIANPKGVDDRG